MDAMTPVPVDSIRIGTRTTDGPAEVIHSIASAGGLDQQTLTTANGFAVRPGVYLHRDSVVALLEGFAGQQDGTTLHGSEAARKLREMAAHIGTRGT